MSPADPIKEANATTENLNNLTETHAEAFAKKGQDWENQFRQIAKEKDLMKELGLTAADVVPDSPVTSDELENALAE